MTSAGPFLADVSFVRLISSDSGNQKFSIPQEGGFVVLRMRGVGIEKDRLAVIGSTSQAHAEVECKNILKKMKQVGATPKRIEVLVCGSEGESFVLNVTKMLSRFGIEQIKTKETSVMSHNQDIVLDLDTKNFRYRLLTSDKLAKSPIKGEREGLKDENVKSLKKSRVMKVLIVDDSVPIQKILQTMLKKDPSIEIVGVASNPLEAEELRLKHQPDIMTLDIHMPQKDGVTYLGEVMATDPMPVIMISDLNKNEASPVMRALELGAFDYIQKPSAKNLQDLSESLIAAVQAAFASRERIVKRFQRKKTSTKLRRTSEQNARSNGYANCPLMVIGSSTGGTEVIREMVPQIPSDVPPILVVQHMPEVFTAKFAESLNAIGSIRVIEATHNLSIERGTMYIAPGGRQMRLVRTKTDLLQIQLTDDPPMNRFKPSVDYLFQSIAELDLCRKTRAAILTGMGEDGARGMLKMHQAGAYTVAQNEDSCVVFGMPKAAIEFNSVDEVGDIDGVLRGLLSGSVNDKAA